MSRDIDEDLIEATIRRVAESKAAREAPGIEMPIAESIAPEGDKTDIEQAIEEAEREPVADAMPEYDDDDDDIEVAPTPLRAAMGGSPVGGGPSIARSAAAAAPAREPLHIPAREFPAREPARSRDFGSDNRAVASAREPIHSRNVDTDDDAVAAQLAEIRRQLDAIMVLLKSLSAGSSPSIGPAWEQAAAATAQRPAIFQDDGARPHSSAPEPEIIDTRPLPEPLPPLQAEPKRGFDLLPRSYRITVEDKRRGVDLVPLHRALLSMDGVRDMSLLSYNNGIAIVALETTEELDPDALGAQVSRAMSRDARVEVHNEHTMVVKLADE